MTPEPGLEGNGLQQLITVFEQVAKIFESALEILQAAQTTVPPPALEDIAEMRQGRRHLTPEAYLLGLLQRAIVGTENVTSDLQGIDMETLHNVHTLNLSGLEFNAIEQAVAERKA